MEEEDMGARSGAPIPMTYMSFSETIIPKLEKEPSLSLTLLKTYMIEDEELLDAVYVSNKTVMVAGVKKQLE